MTKKRFRKELYVHFIDNGGSPKQWPRLLRMQVSGEELEAFRKWGISEWRAFVASHASLLREETAIPAVAVATPVPKEPLPASEPLNEALLERVKTALPAQPWPDGVHKTVASQVGVTHSQASKYIDELIRRGDFMPQVDGQLFPGGG